MPEATKTKASRNPVYSPFPGRSGTYGAPLGRTNKAPLTIKGTGDFNTQHHGKIYLKKVTLDSGGYDKGGTYWGLRFGAESLYVAHDRAGDFIEWLDATSRDNAKSQLVEKHGNTITFLK